MLDFEEISFGHRDPTSHKYYVSTKLFFCILFSGFSVRKVLYFTFIFSRFDVIKMDSSIPLFYKTNNKQITNSNKILLIHMILDNKQLVVL